MIINANSKLALEIEGGIDADGMGLVQNTKYKYKNQLWKFIPAWIFILLFLCSYVNMSVVFVWRAAN